MIIKEENLNGEGHIIVKLIMDGPLTRLTLFFCSFVVH